jgi:hypothetical protein
VCKVLEKSAKLSSTSNNNDLDWLVEIGIIMKVLVAELLCVETEKYLLA